MPKRGENIYKRKDGRWEGRFAKEKQDGKTHYGYVYAKTYAEVKEKLLYEKTHYMEVTMLHSNKNFTFHELAEEWFCSLQPQIKESSSVKYRNILESYLYPTFSNRNIYSIEENELREFAGSLLKNGKKNQTGLSPKSVTGIISVMKSVFLFGNQKGFDISIDTNNIYIKQNPHTMRILSLPEQEKIYDYICKNLDLCNLGILVCMYTGLRIGEICALKWQDISFVEQYIYVHQTMQRLQNYESTTSKTKVLVTPPKSSCSIRKIPIPDEIFTLMAPLRQKENSYFLTGSDHKYVEPRSMQYRFQSVIKKCNIPPTNFHTLRHTFATRCVELGFDVKSLSEILGHASVNITMNRYVHPSMELKQENMNKLSDLFAVK